MQSADLSTAVVQIVPLVESWFATSQRPLPWRVSYDPYQVWVSEVMLQQTRMEVVLPYFARFIERFPSLEALASASEHDVLATWSGLGYYRRARMLREGAIAVLERFGGKIPARVDELLTLPGVGRYTAGAIASVAHDRHAPIVDGNVARIVARLFAIEAPLASPALMRSAWIHAEALVEASKSPRAFNQGLMEIGALICTPRRPSCLTCPLHDHCAARLTGRVSELPVPKVKKETRELRIPLYFVTDRRGRLLMRVEEGPLMSGMYHLPHGDDALFARPLEAKPLEGIGSFRHTVTTRKIEFVLYTAAARRVRDSADRYEWIDPAALDAIPHPSYVKKAVQMYLRSVLARTSK